MIAPVGTSPALFQVPQRMELVESFSVDVRALREGKDGGWIKELADGRFRVRAKGQHCGIVNRNNRIYPAESTWGPHTRPESEFMRRVHVRRVTGQLEHPSDGRSTMGLGAIVITEVEAPNERGEVWIVFETMSTEPGKIVACYIRDNVGFGLSSRGDGSVIRNAKGIDEVQPDFTPRSFDTVCDESTPGAEVPSGQLREQRDGCLNRVRSLLLESTGGDEGKARRLAEVQTELALARMFEGSGDLHSRIAAALKWPLKDVRSFSMHALRDMVRPVDPQLAVDISAAIQSGAYMTEAAGVKQAAVMPPLGPNEYLLALEDGSGHYRAYMNGLNQYDVWFEAHNLPPERIAVAMPTVMAAKQAAETHKRTIARNEAKVADTMPYTGTTVWLHAFEKDEDAAKAAKALGNAGFLCVQDGDCVTIHTGYSDAVQAVEHIKRVLAEIDLSIQESRFGFQVRRHGRIVFEDNAGKGKRALRDAREGSMTKPNQGKPRGEAFNNALGTIADPPATTTPEFEGNYGDPLDPFDGKGTPLSRSAEMENGELEFGHGEDDHYTIVNVGQETEMLGAMPEDGDPILGTRTDGPADASTPKSGGLSGDQGMGDVGTQAPGGDPMLKRGSGTANKIKDEQGEEPVPTTRQAPMPSDDESGYIDYEVPAEQHDVGGPPARGQGSVGVVGRSGGGKMDGAEAPASFGATAGMEGGDAPAGGYPSGGGGEPDGALKYGGEYMELRKRAEAHKRAYYEVMKRCERMRREGDIDKVSMGGGMEESGYTEPAEPLDDPEDLDLNLLREPAPDPKDFQVTYMEGEDDDKDAKEKKEKRKKNESTGAPVITPAYFAKAPRPLGADGKRQAGYLKLWFNEKDELLEVEEFNEKDTLVRRAGLLEKKRKNEEEDEKKRTDEARKKKEAEEKKRKEEALKAAQGKPLAENDPEFVKAKKAERAAKAKKKHEKHLAENRGAPLAGCSLCEELHRTHVEPFKGCQVCTIRGPVSEAEDDDEDEKKKKERKKHEAVKNAVKRVQDTIAAGAGAVGLAKMIGESRRAVAITTVGAGQPIRAPQAPAPAVPPDPAPAAPRVVDASIAEAAARENAELIKKNRYLTSEVARLEQERKKLNELIDSIVTVQKTTALDKKLAEVLREHPELHRVKDRLALCKTPQEIAEAAKSLLGEATATSAPAPAPAAAPSTNGKAHANGATAPSAAAARPTGGASVASAAVQDAPKGPIAEALDEAALLGTLSEGPSAVDDTSSRVAEHRRRRLRQQGE